MSSEHEQPAAPGREPSGETPNAEPRPARDAGRQGGGGRERDRDRDRRGRRGGGGHPQQQQQRQQPQGQQQRRGAAESSLNMDELRELTELFTTHGLTDFEFENADIRIRLSRNPAPSAAEGFHAVVPHPAPSPQALMHTAASAQPAQGGAPPAPAGSEGGAAATAATPAEAPEEELHVITSPIVGTFYRAPSPQADSFVKVGSQVEMGTVVCIIEAMKLMNEIQAETTGTVAKIYVENGQPVEYGQPLFGVKK